MEEKSYDFYLSIWEALDNKESYFWETKAYSAYCKKNDDRKKEKYRDQLKGFNQEIKSQNRFLGKLGLYKPIINIRDYPKYSFFIQFRFKLRKPFYSNGDDDFYIIENSVTKEHVFKVPMMRASSWKGNLRSTVIKINNIEKDPEDSNIIKRLFGYTTETGKNQKKGRLIFYPTYFDQIGLEIIAPHDRNTKTVKNPILYEVVPKGSSGFFSLLYTPFDLIGIENPSLEEIQEDYKQISNAVKEMLKIYGFGAKTSSGFGAIEDRIESTVLKINFPLSEKYSPPLSDISTVNDFVNLISLEG